MGLHRTCGEPNEIELTPIGVELNGHHQAKRRGPSPWRPTSATTRATSTRASSRTARQRSGNIFRVDIFLDFVRLTTRAEGPHGAHARGAKRNRSDHSRAHRLFYRSFSGRIYLVHNVVFRNKSGADEGGDEDEDEGGGGGLRMRGRSGELRFRDPITLATSRDGYAFDTAHAVVSCTQLTANSTCTPRAPKCGECLVNALCPSAFAESKPAKEGRDRDERETS